VHCEEGRSCFDCGTEPDVHFEASTFRGRRACKFGELGEPAIVDRRNASRLLRSHHMAMIRLGRCPHTALRLADLLEFAPG